MSATSRGQHRRVPWGKLGEVAKRLLELLILAERARRGL
jgi:hypothetical protein